MNTTIVIKDETLTGDSLHEFTINIKDTNTITVQELIRQRVIQEVERFNRSHNTTFHGLVQPNNTEIILNHKYQLREFKPVDAEAQVYRALAAFQQNAFFILIDQRQVETLEECIDLHPGLSVSFIKLTPLVGG
jgi:hypothetical protein